jgi:hypothetical protein
MSKKLLMILQQKMKVSLVGCFLFFCSLSFAQQKTTVTGNIIADNNTPLAGVSVNIKGRSGGTTTDMSGKFTIQANKGTTLIFSFVGYEPKQVQVGSDADLGTLSLVSTTASLGEVVVVGLERRKKRLSQVPYLLCPEKHFKNLLHQMSPTRWQDGFRGWWLFQEPASLVMTVRCCGYGASIRWEIIPRL